MINKEQITKSLIGIFILASFYSILLRRTRLANCKFFSALVQELRVSAATMSHFELDDVEPPFDTLAALCTYFNISHKRVVCGVYDVTPVISRKGAENETYLQRCQP